MLVDELTESVEDLLSQGMASDDVIHARSGIPIAIYTLSNLILEDKKLTSFHQDLRYSHNVVPLCSQ